MPRRWAGAALVVALTAGLTGCATLSDRVPEVGCPAGLSDAFSDRAVVGGTPTVRVQVVPPSWLGVPMVGPLRNACVLRLSYVFQPREGVLYWAITPGGAVEAGTIAAALLRTGWVAANGSTDPLAMDVRTQRLAGPRDETATVGRFSASQFRAALPARYRLPSASSYARGSVVVLDLSAPHELAGETRGG